MHYDDDPRIVVRDTRTEITHSSNFGVLTAAAVIFAAVAALGVIWMVTTDDAPSAPPVPAPTVIMPIQTQPAPQPLPPLVMSPLPDPVAEADRRAAEKANRDAQRILEEAKRKVPPIVTVPETELEVKPVPQPEVPHD